jgi:hypothetical protein
MKTQIKFNENNYLAEVQSIELGCNKLNDLKLQIETFTGLKINSKQIFQLTENPIDIIREYVNTITPETLRNANFDFKLEALGLTNSFNRIVNYVAENHGTWVAYQYDFEKGSFVFKGYEDLKQIHTLYAETETEKTKLDYFNKLKDLLNEGFDSSLLNINSRPEIIRTIKELNIDVPTGENEFKVVINPYTIKDVD